MRIISCTLQNFASYKNLEFDFENQGLTLIQGATGSGKSTLCDAIPWILFGRTAKDGAVDEVLSWPGDQTVSGTIIVEFKRSPDIRDTDRISICRTRGPKAGNNDLKWWFTGTYSLAVNRGKDLNDTQKLINNFLGFDSALYLSGAYFHEFSQTAQFFTTTAKNRRVICEQLVDLSLAKNLQLKLVEQKKELTAIHQTNASDIRLYSSMVQNLSKPNDYKKRSENFEDDKLLNLKILRDQLEEIEIKPDYYFMTQGNLLRNARFELGSDICGECGSKKHSDKHEELLKIELELINEERINNSNRTRRAQLNAELKKTEASENIYNGLLFRTAVELNESKEQLDITKELQHNTTISMSDIELLFEVVDDLRGVSIKNTIQQLESQTNILLSKHLDAEIKVLFDVVDADKLDVTILKDGNNCAYSQLSKGQRQLLKLCFGVSVMRIVANRHGIRFNCAFFDESMDGMDDSFKVKTYRLLEELALEYESIFVVEHNEALKSLFNSKYTVELVNGSSVIEKN